MIFLTPKINKTKRIAFLIEYKGDGLVGWQKQNNGVSVQGEIEHALKILFKMNCNLQAAGRTDAGVHALGQVAHVDVPLNNDFSIKNNFYLVAALNSLLRKSNIRIISIQNTSDDFNARFSALKRSYLYKFLCRSAPSAILKNQVWHIRKKIDIESMKKASKYLIGNHDFTSFRSTSCQATSPCKTIDKFEFSFSEDILTMRIEAKSFLHNQVRSFVGTLERVGSGSWSPADVKKALEAKDRSLCGPVSPPHGLYLSEVVYENDPFS